MCSEWLRHYDPPPTNAPVGCGRGAATASDHMEKAIPPWPYALWEPAGTRQSSSVSHTKKLYEAYRRQSTAARTIWWVNPIKVEESL